MNIETPQKAWIVGVGPGLGASLSRLLCRKGLTVLASARTSNIERTLQESVKDAAGALHFYPCDVTQQDSIQTVVQQLKDTNKLPDILIYNVGQIVIKSFLDLAPEEHEQNWRVNCHGAALCAAAVLPHMQQQKHGSILFTGATASIRGGKNFSAFASSKFALRGMAQSLAREFGPQGIHVAHILIDGLIWGAQAQDRFKAQRDACLEPDAIAETYWHLIQQPRATWSHEVDLRPYNESF